MNPPDTNPPENREAVMAAVASSYPCRTKEWLTANYAPAWLPWLLFVKSPLANAGKPGKEPARAGWQNPIGGKIDLHLIRLAAHLSHETEPGNIGLQPPPGVIALDFDKKEYFETAHAAYPQAPAQRTAKGGHLVFRLPAGLVGKNDVALDLGDGLTCDVRVQGGYIVVAPSVHTTGAAYEWIVPLPAEIGFLPKLPPHWVPCVTASRGQLTQETQGTKGHTGSTGPQATQSHQSQGGESIGLSDLDAAKAEAAISATLPRSEGTRHKQIFELARRLQAIPSICEMFNARPALLRGIVDGWYDRARAKVKLKDNAETNWAEFVAGWAQVHTPHGAQLARAVEKAKSLSDPRPAALAEHLGVKHKSFSLLPALFIVLTESNTWPNGAIPMPCRAAGEAINVSQETARAWIAALVAVGFLERVEQGNWGKPTGKASTYRVRPPAKQPI